MDDSYTYSTVNSSTMDPAASAAFGGMILVFGLVYLVVVVTTIVSMWKLFTKAGKPGWAAIVPIYNNVILLEIAGRPWWWVLLQLVPIFGLWVTIVSMLDFAKSYGKSTGWGVFLILVPIIALPMLAFSRDTRYVGPAAAGFDGFMPAPDGPMTAPTVAPSSEPQTPQQPPAAPLQ